MQHHRISQYDADDHESVLGRHPLVKAGRALFVGCLGALAGCSLFFLFMQAEWIPRRLLAPFGSFMLLVFLAAIVFAFARSLLSLSRRWRTWAYLSDRLASGTLSPAFTFESHDNQVICDIQNNTIHINREQFKLDSLKKIGTREFHGKHRKNEMKFYFSSGRKPIVSIYNISDIEMERERLANFMGEVGLWS